jgi:hypothetical protein
MATPNRTTNKRAAAAGQRAHVSPIATSRYVKRTASFAQLAPLRERGGGAEADEDGA